MTILRTYISRYKRPRLANLVEQAEDLLHQAQQFLDGRDVTELPPQQEIVGQDKNTTTNRCTSTSTAITTSSSIANAINRTKQPIVQPLFATTTARVATATNLRNVHTGNDDNKATQTSRALYGFYRNK